MLTESVFQHYSVTSGGTHADGLTETALVVSYFAYTPIIERDNVLKPIRIGIQRWSVYRTHLIWADNDIVAVIDACVYVQRTYCTEYDLSGSMSVK